MQTVTKEVNFPFASVQGPLCKGLAFSHPDAKKLLKEKKDQQAVGPGKAWVRVPGRRHWQEKAEGRKSAHLDGLSDTLWLSHSNTHSHPPAVTPAHLQSCTLTPFGHSLCHPHSRPPLMKGASVLGSWDPPPSPLLPVGGASLCFHRARGGCEWLSQPRPPLSCPVQSCPLVPAGPRPSVQRGSPGTRERPDLPSLLPGVQEHWGPGSRGTPGCCPGALSHVYDPHGDGARPWAGRWQVAGGRCGQEAASGAVIPPRPCQPILRGGTRPPRGPPLSPAAQTQRPRRPAPAPAALTSRNCTRPRSPSALRHS